MKLPNGYGSVYKLSGKRRCPYRAIVTERWQQDKETGAWKQKRKTVGYYETKLSFGLMMTSGSLLPSV